MIRCRKCGAVQDHGKWYAPGTFTAKIDEGQITEGICPGDERIDKQEISGVVRLEGSFIDVHLQDMLNLINNVAKDKVERNIAARISKLESQAGRIDIETTDAHLAEAIGRDIEKAFDGDLQIKWKEGTSQVRIEWKREA